MEEAKQRRHLQKGSSAGMGRVSVDAPEWVVAALVGGLSACGWFFGGGCALGRRDGQGKKGSRLAESGDRATALALIGGGARTKDDSLSVPVRSVQKGQD